ncbi:MAG TPA: hypothetical protein VL988_04720 [Solirubrobacteraceae bacterium]|nr:hypothetical protein [Solirubrobacteraceae bacterium]
MTGVASAASKEPLTVVGKAPLSMVLEPCSAGGSLVSTDAEEMESGECRASDPGTRSGEVVPSPSLVGSLVFQVHNAGDSPLRIRLHYVRDDGAQVILPGESVFARLRGQRSPTKAALEAVIARLEPTELPHGLSGRAEAILSALAKLREPQPDVKTTADVPPALLGRTLRALRRGRRPVARKELDRLAAELSQLLAPPASGAKLGRADVERVLADLRPGRSQEVVVRMARWLFKRLSAGSSVAVPPHATVVLPVRFLALMPLRGGKVAAPATVSGLGGVLFVERTDAEAQPLTVPVVPSVPAPEGVALERSSIGLAPATTKATTTIAIVGPGVATYVGSVSAHRRRFALHNDAGGVADFTLGAFTLDRDDPQRATAQLKLTNHAQPGQYHGNASIAELIPAAPQLDITVRDRLPLWLAFVVVALGVLVGTVAQRLYTMRSQRRELSKALDRSFETLKAIPMLMRGVSAGNVAAWDISELKETAKELQDEIAGARDDADIRESTDRLLDVIARLQRWLRIEPASRRLLAISRRPVTQSWQSSSTSRDTGLLLLALKREPKDAAAADDIVWRTLRQANWHSGLADAWKRSLANAASHAEVEALDQSLAQGDVFARTPADQDKLDLELQRVRSKVGLPPILKPTPTSITPKVDWNADPARFKGWAVYDGTEFARIRGKVKRPVWDLPKRRPSRPTLSLGDLVWTLLPILLSCLVYTLTVYGRTWGSVKDILTALVAGVAGKVVVDYAALPLFRSRRLRPSAGGGPVKTS